MINPPYSLDKKYNSATREYPIIQKINENEDKLKKLSKSLKELKKKEQTTTILDQISRIEKDIPALESIIDKDKKDLENNRMSEVVISKEQDELDFVASMLHYLKVV